MLAEDLQYALVKHNNCSAKQELYIYKRQVSLKHCMWKELLLATLFYFESAKKRTWLHQIQEKITNKIMFKNTLSSSSNT